MDDILIIRQPKNDLEYQKINELALKNNFKDRNKLKNSEKDDFYSSKGRVNHFIALVNGNIIGYARLLITEIKQGILDQIFFENERYIRNLIHLLGHIEWFLLSSGIAKINVIIRNDYVDILKRLNYQKTRGDEALINQDKVIMMSKTLSLPKETQTNFKF
ncbi:MAG: hypothetical protein GF317_18495 [Candidatus Lokiarchaeota archaeon]|nr:hypothetical protein [Candidatus Lokiarchaeota archaeon]MBD3201506.1 hypothetical protein [Candidatus Lokiarchaeota archaeon]